MKKKRPGNYAVALSAMGAVGALLLFSGMLELAGYGITERLKAVFIATSSYQLRKSHPLQPWCPSVQSVANGSATAKFPVSPFPANFWFVKTVKTGSSTLTSVFHSICNNYGIQWLKSDITRLVVGVAKPKADKLEAVQQTLVNLTDVDYLAITNHMYFNQRVADALKPKFQFTTVRHPLGRVHSHYVQDQCVTAAKQKGWDVKLPHRVHQEVGPNACDLNPEFLRFALANDTVEARWGFANSRHGRDQVFNYIRGDKTTVQDAAAQYDFLFTAERMNEALVIFMLKFGLTYEDIAYLPLKVRKGMYKTASDMPPELNDFIMSNNQVDLQLWEIANNRLDQEKAALWRSCGEDVVDNALEAYEALLDEVRTECTSYQEWFHNHGFGAPYTYTGLAELAYDSGNGFRCVKYVARRFMLRGPADAGDKFDMLSRWVTGATTTQVAPNGVQWRQIVALVISQMLFLAAAVFIYNSIMQHGVQYHSQHVS